MQVRLSTATRVRSGATLSSTRERPCACRRLSCGLHFAVAGCGVRVELRTAVLCRTGVIHDPVKQTCIFDTEWSSGSSGPGGGRRRVEAIEAAECAVDPSEVAQGLEEVKRQTGKAAVETSEVKQELSELKQQLRKAEQTADAMHKAEEVQAQELGEVKQQLRKAEEAADDMKQQLRKAEEGADDMKRQVGDISGELREIKALLKQLAVAQ